MNFDKSTRHEDTLEELAHSVRHYRRDPDVDYFLNKWAKERMEDIRRFYGVPKTALASMLGTTYRQYIRYEGDSSKVPVQVVSALALFYNLSLDFICGLDNTPRKLYEGEPLNVNGCKLSETWGTAHDPD